MSEQSPDRGEIEYVAQGYALRWAPGGVEIRATECQATQPRFSWDELCALARRAGWKPGAGDGGPTPSPPR